MRYGMIRARALTPRESLKFVEKVLGGDMSIKLSAEGLSALPWVKSSNSTNGGPECARLAVTPAAWSGFVAHAVTS